ncbi:unnamed protein product [Urochloa decumbens]|uniref:Cyclin N-terminal domain-containing protein n=1 Tax=Urochloa decumbens TaxID=240449 RepID=A0ABC9EHC8_9POAL
MEILDPYAHEPLACPPLPAFDPSFGAGDVYDYEGTDITELDDYLRTTGVWDAMDYGVGLHLPATHELYAAAIGAHALPATPPPSPPPASSSYDDGAAATLDAYDSDIDASLRATERDARERPSPDYLDNGGGIDPLGRAALVAWMSGLAGHFGIDDAALHRAVSYLDRFLSSAAITTPVADLDYRLRVVAAAAVYAAAKLEDSAFSRRVNAGDIAASCGFAASKEVLDAERALLAALGYRLGGPTAHTFVEHFTRRGCGGVGELELVRRAAHAFAGASLLDHRCCLGLLPSAVAAAAILLVRMSLAPAPHGREQLLRWGAELEEMTPYRPADVYEAVESMYMLMPVDPGFGISPLLFANLNY